MKFVKAFEILNDSEFLIAELLPEKNIHLMKIEYVKDIDDVESCFTAEIFEPVSNSDLSKLSSSFYLFHGKNDKYVTEYGYVYKMLYKTNDKRDVIRHYEILTNAKKYNL